MDIFPGAIDLVQACIPDGNGVLAHPAPFTANCMHAGYFQPARSMSLTASALYWPSRCRFKVSALNLPMAARVLLTGMSGRMGYSWLTSADHALASAPAKYSISFTACSPGR